MYIPQMAPIMWLPIFISLIFIFLLMKVIVYFNNLDTGSIKDKQNLLYTKYSWLW